MTRIEEEKHTKKHVWIGLKKTLSHHLLNSSTSKEVLLVMMTTKSFTISALPPFLLRPDSSPFNVVNAATGTNLTFVSFLFYFNLHLPIYLN